VEIASKCEGGGRSVARRGMLFIWQWLLQLTALFSQLRFKNDKWIESF
jgi:hypothetical protein